MHFLGGMHFFLCLKQNCLVSLKDLHKHDVDFAEIFVACEKFSENKYYRHNGFLFKANKLCVPKCSIRELLFSEPHEGGLMGHFGVRKTLEILQEH